MDDNNKICLEPKCEDNSAPSITDMAKGFLNSAQDVISGAISGDGVLASEEVYNHRMSICNSCVYFKQQENRCTQCGCYMEVKTRFKKTFCPIHKWESE